VGRHKKQTVDYFPHMVAHKRTMFVIEGKWGNDGYAFWFKLLEILGSTEGHFFDCNPRENWEFLQAKTRFNDSKTRDILDTLAGLNAIDAELWKDKIIWSQNFVDGITPVYDNRHTKPPEKPKKISTPNLREEMPYLLRPLESSKVDIPISNPSYTDNYSKKRDNYYPRVEQSRVEQSSSVEKAFLPVEKKPVTAPAGAAVSAEAAALLNSPQRKKDKQLADLADLLQAEDPEEYQKLLQAHPELAVQNSDSWEVK